MRTGAEAVEPHLARVRRLGAGVPTLRERTVAVLREAASLGPVELDGFDPAMVAAVGRPRRSATVPLGLPVFVLGAPHRRYGRGRRRDAVRKLPVSGDPSVGGPRPSPRVLPDRPLRPADSWPAASGTDLGRPPMPPRDGRPPRRHARPRDRAAPPTSAARPVPTDGPRRSAPAPVRLPCRRARHRTAPGRDRSGAAARPPRGAPRVARTTAAPPVAGPRPPDRPEAPAAGARAASASSRAGAPARRGCGSEAGGGRALFRCTGGCGACWAGGSVRGGGCRPPDGALPPLVSVHVQQHPDADVPTLERAYAVAEEQHRGQRRKSGEPFITHPLAVAMILANLGLDTTTLAAALLHDTIEDTGYTLARTQQDFGLEVAHLVDGVTKLDKVRFGDDAEAETLRKMIVAGGRDLRVLVIKLADRLHNMRTLRYQPAHKQQRIARATQDVLVPLADRLGIHVLKRELEGLCFAVLQPAEAEAAARLDRERRPYRARLAAAVAAELAPELRAARIGARVTERPRHLYSAYRTSRERGGSGAELLDAARVLVLVQDGIPADCYAVLGLVHGRWRPVPGRFKDHIAVPKFNLYQSLHTTVLGPGGEPVDVLIRTESMHRVAEHGVAAHLQAADRPGALGAAGRPGHGVAAPSAGLATGGRRRGRVLPYPARRPRRRPRGAGVHRRRRRGAAAGRLDPGRPCVRAGRIGRPPHDRRPGQRRAGPAVQPAGRRRPGGDPHLGVGEPGPVPGLAHARCARRTRRCGSSSGSPSRAGTW